MKDKTWVDRTILKLQNKIHELEISEPKSEFWDFVEDVYKQGRGGI